MELLFILKDYTINSVIINTNLNQNVTFFNTARLTIIFSHIFFLPTGAPLKLY